MAYKTEEELEQELKDLGVEITLEYEEHGRVYIDYRFNDRNMTASGGTRRNALMSVLTFIQQWT